MKRILESGYKDTVCYRKLKGEPDASDSPKYAPQRRTAIHIYSIQDLNKKCKIFHRGGRKIFCVYGENLL